MWQLDTKAVQSTTHNQITDGPGERFASSSSVPAVIRVSEEGSSLPPLLHKAFPGCSEGAAAVASHRSLSCIWGRFVVVAWFEWLVCNFRTVLGISC